MGRRRNSQSLAALVVERQRQAQRQLVQQSRLQQKAAIEAEQAERRARREAARRDRLEWERYQLHAEAQAYRRTSLIESRLAELDDILLAGLRKGPVRADDLKESFEVPPMEPGSLAIAVQPPDPSTYVVPKPSGLAGMTPKARREHEAADFQARAAFDRDNLLAWEAEQRRRAALAQYTAEYQSWCEGRWAELNRQNRAIDQLARRFEEGGVDAVADYCRMVLAVSSRWPEDFPSEVETDWNAAESQLVIWWELPSLEAIPTISRVRYVRASDREMETPLATAELRQRYKRLIAACALRVLVEVLQVDVRQNIRSISFNGFATSIDPASGVSRRTWLIAGSFGSQPLRETPLQNIDPVAYVERLSVRISSRPDKYEAVQPTAVPPTQSGYQLASTGTVLEDLKEMDPIELEQLVCRLFAKMGFEASTTTWSGDGGIDIDAVNIDPIFGGRVIVQVKRYTSTVSPTAVRDLFGTVQHVGAIKGILVTTSGFGPESYEFAAKKPLTLINGSELVNQLRRHGLIEGGTDSPKEQAVQAATD